MTAVLMTFAQLVSAESWENNLIIDLPKGNDVTTSDWNELECLAVNIYHEARGESILGQELVAQVTVNRVNSPHYEDHVCGVVRQYKQFSWTHDGRSDAIKDRKAYEKAYRIAIRFLYIGKTANIAGAEDFTNYHTVEIDPDWHTLEAAVDVGRHRFYRRASA